MAISHDEYDFGASDLHSPIAPIGPDELPIAILKVFGVNGEAHIVGKPYGRDYGCDYELSGFETCDLLYDKIEDIESQIGQLTGTLTFTGDNARTLKYCTFMGYNWDKKSVFLDASGVNGWSCKGQLYWRKRKRG